MPRFGSLGRWLASASAAAVCAPGSALAAIAPPDGPPAAQAPAEEVVVTGSRRVSVRSAGYQSL